MEQVEAIDCGGVLDITVVAQWRQQALTALKLAKPLLLKAENLQRVDTAGLQTLLALFKTAEQNSIAVQWDSPSPVLQQAARLIGLSVDLRLT